MGIYAIVFILKINHMKFLKSLFLFSLFFVQQISAQNLTVKKTYHRGSLRLLYEYQILPNGIHHGYFKEYSYDGLLVANYTKKLGVIVGGIHYFQDGKTVQHEYNQDENLLPHGTQKMNAFSNDGQIFTQHISQWNHGKIVSGKSMSNPAEVRFKYENGNVTKYRKVDGKMKISDKYNIDDKNLVTGYFREDFVNLHYSKGLLMKVNAIDDSSKIFLSRTSKDTLMQVFEAKDSMQWFYYYFDTTRLKAFISYNSEAGCISMQYLGFGRSDAPRYDQSDDFTYVLMQGRGEEDVVVKKAYFYPNYPESGDRFLRYLETKAKNAEFYKVCEWFTKDKKLESQLTYKRLPDGQTEMLLRDGSGKLIDSAVVRQ